MGMLPAYLILRIDAFVKENMGAISPFDAQYFKYLIKREYFSARFHLSISPNLWNLNLSGTHTNIS